MENILVKQMDVIFRQATGDTDTFTAYKYSCKRFISILTTKYKLQKLKNIKDKHIRFYKEVLRSKNLKDEVIQKELEAIRFMVSHIKNRESLTEFGESKNKMRHSPPTICHYCEGVVDLVDNKVIFGKNHGNGKCYRCRNCNAYVAVCSDLITPIGRLRDPQLHKMKKKAHFLFDSYWKQNRMNRSEAYFKLADKLGIPKKQCHFKLFDKEITAKAIYILEKGL